MHQAECAFCGHEYDFGQPSKRETHRQKDKQTENTFKKRLSYFAKSFDFSSM